MLMKHNCNLSRIYRTTVRFYAKQKKRKKEIFHLNNILSRSSVPLWERSTGFIRANLSQIEFVHEKNKVYLRKKVEKILPALACLRHCVVTRSFLIQKKRKKNDLYTRSIPTYVPNRSLDSHQTCEQCGRSSTTVDHQSSPHLDRSTQVHTGQPFFNVFSAPFNGKYNASREREKILANGRGKKIMNNTCVYCAYLRVCVCVCLYINVRNARERDTNNAYKSDAAYKLMARMLVWYARTGFLWGNTIVDLACSWFARPTIEMVRKEKGIERESNFCEHRTVSQSHESTWESRQFASVRPSAVFALVAPVAPPM